MHKNRTIKGNHETKSFRRFLRSESTIPEQRMWTQLRANRLLGLKFKRQHGMGAYIADFYCAEKKVVIELDGDSHVGQKAFDHDRKRDAAMKIWGARVIRLSNEDIMNDMDTVLEFLAGELTGESTFE